MEPHWFYSGLRLWLSVCSRCNKSVLSRINKRSIYVLLAWSLNLNSWRETRAAVWAGSSRKNEDIFSESFCDPAQRGKRSRCYLSLFPCVWVWKRNVFYVISHQIKPEHQRLSRTSQLLLETQLCVYSQTQVESASGNTHSVRRISPGAAKDRGKKLLTIEWPTMNTGRSGWRDFMRSMCCRESLMYTWKSFMFILSPSLWPWPTVTEKKETRHDALGTLSGRDFLPLPFIIKEKKNPKQADKSIENVTKWADEMNVCIYMCVCEGCDACCHGNQRSKNGINEAVNHSQQRLYQCDCMHTNMYLVCTCEIWAWHFSSIRRWSQQGNPCPVTAMEHGKLWIDGGCMSDPFPASPRTLNGKSRAYWRHMYVHTNGVWYVCVRVLII